jgi:uncharacterized protein (DUF2384 family)
MNYVELIQLQAEQVFADKEKAGRWLTKPQIAFGHATPLEISCDETGYRTMKELLDKIDHGFSF